MKRMHLLAMACVLCTPYAAQAADNMKAFPPAEAGMVRFVIQVPKMDDEFAFKVELIVGKTVEVEPRNKYFFGGTVSEEVIQGWGFTRYVLKELGPMAGTLMAIDPNEPKVKRFIAVGNEPNLLRYNSLLPIVVYVPKGVEVRYRIWSAGAEQKAAETSVDNRKAPLR
jgi:ecotin